MALVQFDGNRPAFYTTNGLELNIDDALSVEWEFGPCYGQYGRVVNMVGWTKQIPEPVGPGLRACHSGICVSTNMAHTKFCDFKVTANKLNQCR